MKILIGTIMTIFLGLMFISLFHVSGNMDRSHSISGAAGCPFMAHEEVLCSMSLSEHIGAWKTVFSNLITPTFTLLLTLSVAVLLTATKPPHLLIKRLLQSTHICWRQLQCSTYTYTVRPWQELFSSGILHPKLF